MKKKRILAMLLAVTSCLSLAVSASAANTVNRKATDFRDFDKSAWYAEAVSAAVGIDNLNNYQFWNFHPYPQRSYMAELKVSL